MALEEMDRIKAKISQIKENNVKKTIALVLLFTVVSYVLVIMSVTIIPNLQYKLHYKRANDKYSSSIRAASVGDTIKFGRYEQDNDFSNGVEEIEWIVLIDEGNRLGVISKYALERQPYDTSFLNVLWGNCYLRKWLNETFLNTAFDSGEQTLIQRSTVTGDYVFLLSLDEATYFFGQDNDRQCQGTAYCDAQDRTTILDENKPITESNGNCWWWLRTSSGYSYRCADAVSGDGAIIIDNVIASSNGAVRPAMWINLES